MAPLPLPRPPSPASPTGTALSIRTTASQLAALAHRGARAYIDTVVYLAKRHIVQRNLVAIPATYSGLNTGPPAGQIVGIVLGSVAGFILVLYLIYSCQNGTTADIDSDSSVVVREHRKKSHHSHSARSRRSERVVEVPIVERVVVEERREDRRERSRVRSDSSGPDEVIVIEDHSPPRRSKSHRRESGTYRPVDPGSYGGGDAPMREVRRESSRRSRG